MRRWVLIWVEATWIHMVTWNNFGQSLSVLARWPPTKSKYFISLSKKGIFVWFAHKNCCTCRACSKTAIKMTIFNDHYVLYDHTILSMTNYYWKTAGTKTVPDRPSQETVHLYRLCVASCTWDSINYLWDWALLLVFVSWPKCQVQLMALGWLGKLWIEIIWWKFGVMKNLKQQNWSVGCNLSKSAIKKTIQQK